MASLPEYERPPLDEVVFGVQFAPLKGFRAVHLGAFWQTIRSRYPLSQEQPPLAHMIEQPKVKFESQPAEVILGVPKVPRVWFLTPDKTRLIQVQKDRFLLNWRLVTGNEQYPRYISLIDEFKGELAGFLSFMAKEGIGEVVIDQCELTYVNNIEQAGVGELADLPAVFATVKPFPDNGFLPSPEVLTWTARYKLPNDRGRLHVTVNQGMRGRDLKPVYIMNLTARGAPEGPDCAPAFAWFDLAHEWIVRAFDELTDPAMHAQWGKR